MKTRKYLGLLTTCILGLTLVSCGGGGGSSDSSCSDDSSYSDVEETTGCAPDCLLGRTITIHNGNQSFYITSDSAVSYTDKYDGTFTGTYTYSKTGADTGKFISNVTYTNRNNNRTDVKHNYTIIFSCDRNIIIDGTEVYYFPDTDYREPHTCTNEKATID